MERNRDSAAQTAWDMEQARNWSKLNVVATRDFLYGTFYRGVCIIVAENKTPGSNEEWTLHKSIVDILSEDPVLTMNRSRRQIFLFPRDPKYLLVFLHRYFMSRKEQFESSLSVQCRLDELRGKHGWTGKEASIAARATGEVTAMNLHTVGMSLFVAE